jgi:hypothetical protein
MPTRPDREAVRCQAAYLGSAHQLLDAIRTLAELDVSLVDENGSKVPAWTPEQHQAVRACALAWTDLVTKRRDYDDFSRYLKAPEAWPHA